MDVCGITNKGVVGFKYFGFGGLNSDTKGVKAFSGVKVGDGATLNINLSSQGHGACKIHVMLDGPYNNSTWNGKELGIIEVPNDGSKQAKTFSLKVPQVEGLTGKHAIYIVCEGPDVEEPKPKHSWEKPQKTPYGLFDLHGIGFTKNGESLKVSKVPQLTITVDGNILTIPETPVYFTNFNGYFEANHYQVYGPMTDKSTLKVSCDNPEVKISVSKIVEGRATVKAVYKGKEKVFLIN